MLASAIHICTGTQQRLEFLDCASCCSNVYRHITKRRLRILRARAFDYPPYPTTFS